MPKLFTPQRTQRSQREGHKRLLVLCFAFSVYSVLSVADKAFASVLTVGPGKGFQTVNDALKKAAKGDTIELYDGVYNEVFVIEKPVAIVGRGKAVVKGLGTGTVIRIKAADVTIEGLNIQGSGNSLEDRDAGIFVEGSSDIVIKDNTFENCAFGMWINGSKNVKVVRNHVIGQRQLILPKRGNGIHFWNVRNSLVEGNVVEGARDGLFVDLTENTTFKNNKIFDLRYGIHYMFSHNNRLEGNITYNNRAGLAMMYSNNLDIVGNYSYNNEYHALMLYTMRNCRVHNNVAAGAEKGMFVYDAQFNEIRDNLVANNDIGVHVWAGTTDNKIYDNSFINNRSQIKYVGMKDQEWAEGKKGNFWSDYLGWDTDSDGVGDLPHIANSLTERLVWSYPVVKLLFNSPAVQTLRMVESQFPILRAPSVMDSYPLMKPHQKEWKKWVDISAGRAARAEGSSESSGGVEM